MTRLGAASRLGHGRPSRRWLLPAAVVALEVSLYVSYAGFGAQFHYWLHALFGAAAGFALLASRRLARRQRVPGPWSAGALGHLWSAAPDVLFTAAGVLHVAWMDVFAVHISLHFIPAPLLTAWTVFVLTLAAWAAAELRRRRLAGAGLGLALVVVAAALLLRSEIPSSLEDVRDRPGMALLCPVAPGAAAPDAGPYGRGVASPKASTWGVRVTTQ